ncbi:MAG: ABC transporter permease [Gemmatimonadaceae bacterium]
MPQKSSRFFQVPWRSRSSIARDVDTELSFHLEMRVNELKAQGMSPEDAARRAKEEFGDLEFTRAYCRDVDERAERDTKNADRFADWRQDVRYALRTLRRAPGFAAVSLLTLALAIGANTAIFTVARAVLLKPLPYGSPDALFRLYETWQGDPIPLSPADFDDYQAQQRGFTGVAALATSGAVTWKPDNADPESLKPILVGTNAFGVLAVPALHGRTFVPGDELPGSDPTVLLAYRYWQRAFGGDASIVGRKIQLNGKSTIVVGVMPRGFTLTGDEDIWLPLDVKAELKDAVRSRKQHWMQAMARLKPGVSEASALADLQTVARRLALQYPEADSGRIAVVRPMRDVIVGDLRAPLLLLQGAAAGVLLIACANLANLTLSRTMGRRRELAVRAALGAGRSRLIRQLVTESVLLSVVGGVLGILLAGFATRGLLSLNPDALPPMFTAGVDSRVLVFSLALSVTSGILFGLLPALDSARADLHDSLKEGGRGSSAGRGADRIRRGLVVAQVALAFVLLIGAGLLIRSFSELTRTKLGFDPDHVLTAQVRAAGDKYDSAEANVRFYDGVIGAVARSPGVVAVGAMSDLPAQGAASTSLRIEGEATDEKNLPDLQYLAIRNDFFKAMRVPIIAGRAYNETDLLDGPETTILNETAARRFFPKGNAIGHRIRIGPDPNGAWQTIIGIAGDIKSGGIDTPAKPTLHANHRRESWMRTMSLVVRTSGDPAAAESVIRRAVKQEDPMLAVRDVKTLNQVVGDSLASRRFALGLAMSFAFVALTLAAIGIYGVLAYTVTNRTREFGVRIALGASARSVLVLVVRQGLAWSLLGIVLGVAGAVAGGRLLAGMLYGVTPLDASTYAAVIGVLVAVVVAACLIPATRATRVDPLTSMRAD